MSKYVEVGAMWKSKRQDGSFSIKLNDKTNAYVWPNDRKSSDAQPDFRLTMLAEDAARLNLVSEYDKNKADGKVEDSDIAF